MSDNNEVDTKGTEHESETPEVNEQEQVARSQGWRPKEEWTGDPNDWVDADEFNRRKPFFDAIHKVNQKNKRLEEQLTALQEHHNKVRQIERENARKELMEERRAAAKENDLEAVVAVDERLAELDKTSTAPVVPTRHPALDAFAARNTWYDEDEDLQAYANGIGATIEKKNPTLTTEEVLEMVEKKVKERFPDKFQTQTKSTVSSVSPSRPGPSGPGGVKKKKITYNDLPDEAKDVYNKLVKSPRNPYGKMTPDQYLKEYAAISGLPYEE